MAYIDIAEMTNIDKLARNCRPPKNLTMLNKLGNIEKIACRQIAVEDFADDKMVYHRKDIFINDYDLLWTIEN